MMRHLTQDEIERIVSQIKPYTTTPNKHIRHVHEQINKQHQDRLRAHLARLPPIHPEIIPQLTSEILRQYHSSQIQPGDSVGILTAQSIGERQTQLILNSFHSTGITIATAVTGVPRFSELLNATKKPKNVITTIYLKARPTTIQEARIYGTQIKHLLFKDVIQSVSVEEVSRCVRRRDWYAAFHLLPSELNECEAPLPYFIRCKCDLDVLYEYKLHLSDIGQKIMTTYSDLRCMWSPLALGTVDIYIDSKPVKQKKVNPRQYIEQTILPTLNKLTIRGVPGIESVGYTKRGDVRDREEWYIETLGFNLQQVYALDTIDIYNTISNNMWEIYEILGVEAAREFLISEFMKVISVDAFINVRHVQLLVDVMLYNGSISSISRYGVHKNESGALTKCSFEESLDQILKAGMYGEDEHISGVSGAIICGNVSNIGSGLCELLYQQP